jgi:hypothetical protein
MEEYGSYEPVLHSVPRLQAAVHALSLAHTRSDSM